jgi:hypothetical protein
MEVRPSSVRSNDLSSCRRGSDPIDRMRRDPDKARGRENNGRGTQILNNVTHRRTN